jgi:hypothetical protein
VTFVYFIQAGQDGPIKIGVAADPLLRLDDLQVGSPVALTLLAAIPGGAVHERQLHARFAEGRIRGEWFSADTPGLKGEILEVLDAWGGLPFAVPVAWLEAHAGGILHGAISHG